MKVRSKRFFKVVMFHLGIVAALVVSGPCYASGTGTDDGSQPPSQDLINPDFKRQCKWLDGFYECTDFAYDYCLQYPRKEDCFVLHLESPRVGFKIKGHAANIVRLKSSDGTYVYCIVEPQNNHAVVCWEGDESPKYPKSLNRKICEYYKTWGLICPLSREILRLDEYPKKQLHPIHGGPRGPGEPPNSECLAALNGGDGRIDEDDCDRLRGLENSWKIPPECKGQDAARARFLLATTCPRGDD